MEAFQAFKHHLPISAENRHICRVLHGNVFTIIDQLTLFGYSRQTDKYKLRRSTKQMKILVVVPDGNPIYPAWCLEYAIENSKIGNMVHIVNLQSLNTFVYGKKFQRLKSFITRKNRMVTLMRNLCKEYEIVLHRVPNPISQTVTRRNFNSLSKSSQEIFNLSLSSKYGARYGNRNVDAKIIPHETVKLEKYFFNLAYQLVYILIQKHNFDLIVTVNGRLVVSSAVVKACRDSRKSVNLLEAVGLEGDRYCVFQRSPHDLSEVEALQIQFWNRTELTPLLQEELLSSFRSKRSSILEKNGYVFSKKYTRSTNTTRLASFFTTTETEYPVFNDFHVASTFGGNQVKAFEQFVEIAKNLGFSVVVRVHPQNQTAVELASAEDCLWQKICEETGAEFIGSLSEIDSKSLIAQSDLCVTYSSSIGIDVILANKPLMILGETDYGHLVKDRLAHDSIEIQRMMLGGIFPIDVRNILPWINWQTRGGVTLSLFEIDNVGNLQIRGKKVDELRVFSKVIKKCLNIN